MIYEVEHARYVYVASHTVLITLMCIFEHVLKYRLFQCLASVTGFSRNPPSVSYTHLDVYKRQVLHTRGRPTLSASTSRRHSDT